MFSTFLVAAIKIGIPVFVLGYFLISWALKTGYLSEYDDDAGLKANLKSMKAAHKKRKKGKSEDNAEPSMLLEKWLKFGGGFYGTAAFYTYIVIELGEIFSFIGRMLDPANWVFSIGIDLFIGFLINSIVNFVKAIIWFTYWPGSGNNGHIWIWFLVAYGAFAMASRYAREKPFTDFDHLRFWDSADSGDSGAAESGSADSRSAGPQEKR